MLIARGCVPGDIDVILFGLEGPYDRAELLMLAAVVAGDRAAPVSRRRLVGLVDDDTIVRDGLGEVVRQMLAVVKFFVARAGVEGQKAAMVNHEVQSVVMAMLSERAAAREKAVCIILSRAGSYENLPHVIEVPCEGKILGRERIG